MPDILLSQVAEQLYKQVKAKSKTGVYQVAPSPYVTNSLFHVCSIQQSHTWDFVTQGKKERTRALSRI